MAHYDWATLYEKLESCTDCGLCKGRTNVVIGVGNPQSKIMLIGEGPGLRQGWFGVAPPPEAPRVMTLF